MDAKFANAAAAYGNIAKSGGIAGGATAGGGTAKVAGGDFADLVEQSLGSAVESGQKAESMSMQAVTGDVNLGDVVTSVSAAEVALETVVTIRDRVIGAYQDIIKMPI